MIAWNFIERIIFPLYQRWPTVFEETMSADENEYNPAWLDAENDET